MLLHEMLNPFRITTKEILECARLGKKVKGFDRNFHFEVCSN